MHLIFFKKKLLHIKKPLAGPFVSPFLWSGSKKKHQDTIRLMMSLYMICILLPTAVTLTW